MPAILALSFATLLLAAGPPLDQAAYDAAALAWHREWQSRPAPHTDDREAFQRYWQTGDPIRTRLRAVDPPPSRAAYHEALLAYVDAALAAADEGLTEARVTAAWAVKHREAMRRRRALAQAARATDPSLPANWN